MSHSFLTFGCEPSAVVETERPSVCGSLLCGRYLLQEGRERTIYEVNIWSNMPFVNILCFHIAQGLYFASLHTQTRTKHMWLQ